MQYDQMEDHSTPHEILLIKNCKDIHNILRNGELVSHNNLLSHYRIQWDKKLIDWLI